MGRSYHILVALLCVAFSSEQASAQLKSQDSTDYSVGVKSFPNFYKSFKSPVIPETDMANSLRLEQLVREGKLYLSLGDAIALAIENNLDIVSARYGPKIADTDLLRAKSGAQLRGVQTQITNLSTASSVTSSTGRQTGNFSGITGRASGVGGSSSSVGDANTFFGTTTPNLDPVLSGGIDWGHYSNPQTSNFVTGTNTFITETSNSSLFYSKGFLTGTTVSLSWANSLQDTNSMRANFDPSLRSNATLRIRQRLLQGFGRAVNGRNIRISKNNREISDLTFEQQVAETISRVQNLYWDLVSFSAELRSREEDLKLARRLYEDNKRRVEIGILAPIEIVRAEAEMAARHQDVELALTRYQLQGTLLKNAISKNGLASPSLLTIEITPTDRIAVPKKDDIPSIQELMSLALQTRPEMSQSRIQLKNRNLTVKGVRHAMLPQIDLVADVTNNGLAGRLNKDFRPFPGLNNPISEYFLGGLGTGVGQIFRRNFPDYQIGVQVTIPLKNRRAQADMTATLLEKRQAEIRLRQQENAVRTEVNNAVIGVRQARAQHNAAQKARVLQEQTLRAEQRKFDLGASTIFLVVQSQRDLAISRSNEIAARSNYVKTRVELDRATGQTLAANNISVYEAYQGRVSKPADPIPPLSSLIDQKTRDEATSYSKPVTGLELFSFRDVYRTDAQDLSLGDLLLPVGVEAEAFTLDQEMATSTSEL